jgi:hypothetical protein
MAANDGEHPVTDLFGVPLPDGTGALGSAGDRTAPPDAGIPGGTSGIPGVGTAMALSLQAGPGESASTTQPGQNAASQIAPDEGGTYTFTSTGAGQGVNVSATAHGRQPWQQPPGGN